MRAGDVVVDGSERFIIHESASSAGRCVFEVHLAPGAEGPPTHTHDDPEELEMVAGNITFTLDGVERTFTPGERFVIPPGCAHTFRNTSKNEPAIAKGVHSGRFERLIDQLATGSFVRMALYATTVDPRAAYMVSPFVRAFLRTLAVFARVRGLKVAPATGAYGVDATASSSTAS
jgi:mannose-6-phosphate isomerase-like protein (cupin superfamily)